jgi:hypothetical protein
VLLGVVGGAVLPAVPDDVEPGAGEDAYGVGVVVAAGSGAQRSERQDDGQVDVAGCKPGDRGGDVGGGSSCSVDVTARL